MKNLLKTFIDLIEIGLGLFISMIAIPAFVGGNLFIALGALAVVYLYTFILILSYFLTGDFTTKKAIVKIITLFLVIIGGFLVGLSGYYIGLGIGLIVLGVVVKNNY